MVSVSLSLDALAVTIIAVVIFLICALQCWVSGSPARRQDGCWPSAVFLHVQYNGDFFSICPTDA